MRTYFILLILFSIITPPKIYSQSLSTKKKVIQIMDTRIELTAVAENDSIAFEAINAGILEVNRIEKLTSSLDSNSQISLINQNAGIQAIQVDKELYDLIFRAKKISKLTKGAFDISLASMDDFWEFGDSTTNFPTSLEIKNAHRYVNWKNIILDEKNRTVFLKEKGMKISLATIANGYAVNKALAKMKKLKGVTGSLINADGDLIGFGQNNQSENWTLEIEDPKDKTKSIGWLEVDNTAIVILGDDKRFFEFEGKQYSTIIDPRTAYPTNGIKKVIIVCTDAEVAAALGNSVFALGQLEGLSLINQLVGVECLIITNNDKILGSERLKLKH